jgi:hypothetical protein
VHPQGAEPPEINQFKEIDFSSTQEVPDLAEKTVASSSESTETELELEQQLLAEMSSLAEAAGLSDLAADISNTQSHLSLDSGTYFEETDELEPVLSKSEEMRSRQDIDELEIEAQRLDEELQEDSASRDAVKPNDVVLPQSNWPSPVLYPLRPPKRRKSLASIELPSFPRYRPI